MAWTEPTAPRSSRSRPELARDGYIYVGEDIRGRYKSEGKFVMSRPLADHHDPKAIDESTDTYDTVAWLLKNVPGNNGRAGVVGTSYPGFLAMMAGIDPHPAVKAISPQAPMIDVWMGDDFFHNGAFRQSYGYDYVLGMESSKEETEVDYGKDKDGKPRDGFDYFLERGSFAEDVKQSGSKTAAHLEALPRAPSLRLRLVLARRRALARTRSPCPRSPSAATTTRKTCTARRRSTPRSNRTTRITRTFSFSAPGGTATGHPRRAISAISTTASPSARSFARRSRPSSSPTISRTTRHESSGFDLEDTASFQTGSNTWKRYAHFPPAESQPTSLHLAGAGLLSWSRLDRAGQHQLRERSRQSRSLPPSAHPAHLQRRLAVVQLAH